MKQLLNDQVMDQAGTTQLDRPKDIMNANLDLQNDRESEIEKGNLMDYLEIFGDEEDM
jgi:hypothetical protein